MREPTTFVTQRLGLYSSVKTIAVRVIVNELLLIPECYALVGKDMKREVALVE